MRVLDILEIKFFNSDSVSRINTTYTIDETKCTHTFTAREYAKKIVKFTESYESGHFLKVFGIHMSYLHIVYFYVLRVIRPNKMEKKYYLTIVF